MLRSHITITCLAILASLAAQGSEAQEIESPPPSDGLPRATGYLPSNALDFRLLLPSPEREAFGADALISERLNSGSSDARWSLAEADAAQLYRRFDEALGAPLERGARPAAIRLLNRARRDIATVTFQAKDSFQRPRPYQLRQLPRVCGKAAPPAPDPIYMGGSSYPSGHSAYGWTVAFILAEVAPERAPRLLAKAEAYGESRVVCGMHFSSDVEAGRILAAAVVIRLKADPAFQADLAAARIEHLSGPHLDSAAPPRP